MEVIHILHELYEIVWWRCYYLIPEWVMLARIAKMKHPHDTAEEFAREVALPREAFGAMAQKHCYNPITLSAIFQVASGVCFQHLLRQAFSFPYMQIRLDFGQRPLQHAINFEEDGVPARIIAKGGKMRKNLSAKTWPDMCQLRNEMAKSKTFVFAEEWIREAAETQSAEGMETRLVLGLHLPRAVFVTARPHREKVFVQIVPMKYRERLMDELVIARLEKSQKSRSG